MVANQTDSLLAQHRSSTTDDNILNTALTMPPNTMPSIPKTAYDPNALILNAIISDTSTPWQVYNCKINDKIVTQDAPLPFLYHYDALPEDIKATKPLTPELLKQFNTPMLAGEVAELLKMDEHLIKVPWQVKVTGTLVMSCERLQLALRLKFTNTAKSFDPIYCTSAKEALQIAMTHWHFYSDVFVLNKSVRPLIVTDDNQHWAVIERADDYQALNPVYGLSILAELETLKESQTLFDEAVSLRLN